MRLREWLFLLSVCGVGTLLANWIGSGVSIAKSLPGVIILIAVTMAAVVLAKIVPFKLPIIAYCSILGLLVASPFSPIAAVVISSTKVIAFAAPFTFVGSFAGIAISDKLGTFVHQGWKYIIVGVAVMTGTFVGSLLWDTLTLKLTGVI